VKKTAAKHGFTLIEMLVAVTIIATIASLVYGTYFATAQSAQRCRSRITAAQQARTLLEQITRQIRSAYPAPAASLPKHHSRKINFSAEQPVSFSACPATGSVEFLKMITTAGKPTDGIYQVAYKLDAPTGRLLYHQQPFAESSQTPADNQQYVSLAENIVSLRLSFFDGLQWYDRWDSAENKMLPRLVRIDLTLTYDNSPPAGFSTLVQVNCSAGHKSITQTQISTRENQ